MRRAVVPGSFDPVTKGHLDIIERASRIFDEIIVVVLQNPAKHTTFTVEERMDFIRRSTENIGNVSVDSFDGLLVDYMRRKKAGVIVKGLRAVSDFEYEYQMALTNHRLNPDVETLFLNTSQEYMFLSSSIVKKIASFDGDVSDFLPEQIRDDVQQRLRKGN